MGELGEACCGSDLSILLAVVIYENAHWKIEVKIFLIFLFSFEISQKFEIFPKI